MVYLLEHQDYQEKEGGEIVVEEKDDNEKELEKLEKGDPEMIKICNTIMGQLDEFKVNFLFSINIKIHIFFFKLLEKYSSYWYSM